MRATLAPGSAPSPGRARGRTRGTFGPRGGSTPTWDPFVAVLLTGYPSRAGSWRGRTSGAGCGEGHGEGHDEGPDGWISPPAGPDSDSLRTRPVGPCGPSGLGGGSLKVVSTLPRCRVGVATAGGAPRRGTTSGVPRVTRGGGVSPATRPCVLTPTVVPGSATGRAGVEGGEGGHTPTGGGGVPGGRTSARRTLRRPVTTRPRGRRRTRRARPPGGSTPTCADSPTAPPPVTGSGVVRGTNDPVPTVVGGGVGGVSSDLGHGPPPSLRHQVPPWSPTWTGSYLVETPMASYTLSRVRRVSTRLLQCTEDPHPDPGTPILPTPETTVTGVPGESDS